MLVLVIVVLHLRLEFPFAFFNPHFHPERSGFERPHRRGPHASQIFPLLTFSYSILFELDIGTATIESSSIATALPFPFSLEARLSSDPTISPSYRGVYPFFISQLNGKRKAAILRQRVKASQRGG